MRLWEQGEKGKNPNQSKEMRGAEAEGQRVYRCLPERGQTGVFSKDAWALVSVWSLPVHLTPVAMVLVRLRTLEMEGHRFGSFLVLVHLCYGVLKGDFGNLAFFL